MRMNEVQNKKELFFSIIVPVYNAERYLWRCVESIQKQTFKAFESILVDDASQDGSEELCQEICGLDERFRYCRKQHEGAAAARNYGMRNAVGKYVVFVDADDYIADEFLEQLYCCILKNEKEADICYISRHFLVSDHSVRENRVFEFPVEYVQEKLLSKREFLDLVTAQGNHMPGSTWLMVLKRDFVDKYQLWFDEKLIWSEDTDLSYRALICSEMISCCMYCGYYYFQENVYSVSKTITIEKAMGRMDVYSRWSVYFLKDRQALQEFSQSSRERLVQQMLTEYCGILNAWRKLKEKKEKEIIYGRLRKEKNLWKMCQDYQYQDYVRFGIWGGTIIQKLKRIVKKVINK